MSTGPEHKLAQPRELFSDTYGEARQKFLHAAAAAGAKVQTFLLPHQRGPHGEDLCTDIAWMGEATPRALIIVSSATHGIEGFAGSAFQTSLARDVAAHNFKIDDVGVALLHGLNPYGFAHMRRPNESNVDLNRNFRDFSQPLPEARAYETLHSAIVPKVWTGTGRDKADAVLAAARSKLGERGFQNAICQGQYSHPDGLFFGGVSPAWSNDILRCWLDGLPASIEILAHIDVHTGLGPYGYGEILYTLDDDNPAGVIAESLYGNMGFQRAGTDTSSATPVRSTMNHAIAGCRSHAIKVSVSIEFGTVEFARMFAALRAENWFHHHAETESSEMDDVRRELLACFRPDDEEWMSAVLERCWEVFERTSERLSNCMNAGLRGDPTDKR